MAVMMCRVEQRGKEYEEETEFCDCVDACRVIAFGRHHAGIRGIQYIAGEEGHQYVHEGGKEEQRITDEEVLRKSG